MPEQPAVHTVWTRDVPPWRCQVSWIGLCAVSGLMAWPLVLVMLDLPRESRGLAGLGWPGLLSLAALAVVVGVAARLGIKRGWNTRCVLRCWCWSLALVFVALGFIAYNASAAKVRMPSTDKAVLNQARQLAAAADEYYLTHNVTSCSLSDLVGPDRYLKVLIPVAGETYPSRYTMNAPITITGVAGARTITYAP